MEYDCQIFEPGKSEGCGDSISKLENMLTTFPQLDALQTRTYRSVVMKTAYLSQDKPYLSYSTKELARDMQKSTVVRRTKIHNKRCVI